jgi:hypothetical protein
MNAVAVNWNIQLSLFDNAWQLKRKWVSEDKKIKTETKFVEIVSVLDFPPSTSSWTTIAIFQLQGQHGRSPYNLPWRTAFIHTDSISNSSKIQGGICLRLSQKTTKNDTAMAVADISGRNHIWMVMISLERSLVTGR